MSETPNSELLRETMRRHTLTGGQVAHLVGVDGRTVRKWVGGERGMPLSAWRILKICVGELDVADLLKSMPAHDRHGGDDREGT